MKVHPCRVKEDSTGTPSRMDQDKRILAEERLVLRSNSGSAGHPNCFPDFSQQFCTTYEAGYHMMPHTFQTSSRTPFVLPPCLRIADGVLESPLNVPDYHFWLVRQVVDDQTIHFIGDEGNRQITVRFLDTFQITSMLCNNRTFPMGLPSSSEGMHLPWAIFLETLHLIYTALTLHYSKFLPQRY